MSQTWTRAPSASKVSAMARPMPDPPAVIRTLKPLAEISMPHLFGHARPRDRAPESATILIVSHDQIRTYARCLEAELAVGVHRPSQAARPLRVGCRFGSGSRVAGRVSKHLGMRLRYLETYDFRLVRKSQLVDDFLKLPSDLLRRALEFGIVDCLHRRDRIDRCNLRSCRRRHRARRHCTAASCRPCSPASGPRRPRSDCRLRGSGRPGSRRRSSTSASPSRRSG